MESEESQALDTVQLCLRRKAPAGPDGRGARPGAAHSKGSPGVESFAGNQKPVLNPSGPIRSKAWELPEGCRPLAMFSGFSWRAGAHNATSDKNTNIRARQPGLRIHLGGKEQVTKSPVPW